MEKKLKQLKKWLQKIEAAVAQLAEVRIAIIEMEEFLKKEPILCRERELRLNNKGNNE